MGVDSDSLKLLKVEGPELPSRISMTRRLHIQGSKKPVAMYAIVITATVSSCFYYSINVLWPQQIAYLFLGTAIHQGWLACIVGSATLLG